MAIRYHMNDQNRGSVVQDMKNYVNSLSDDKIKKYHTLYKNKLIEKNRNK